MQIEKYMDNTIYNYNCYKLLSTIIITRASWNNINSISILSSFLMLFTYPKLLPLILISKLGKLYRIYNN